MAVDPNDLNHAAQHGGSWAGWFIGGVGAVALFVKRISAMWAADEKNAVVAQIDTATYERLNEQIEKLQTRVEHLESIVMVMTNKDINAKTCAAEMLQILSTMCQTHCGATSGGPADRLIVLAKAIMTGVPPDLFDISTKDSP